MKLIIKTKNLEFTESLEGLITKRMAGLHRLVEKFQESLELLVEVERETKHHLQGDIFKAEAMVNLPGANLVAKAHGENLGRVIGHVKNQLDRAIRKYKTKTIEAPRRKYRRTLPKTQGK